VVLARAARRATPKSGTAAAPVGGNFKKTPGGAGGREAAGDFRGGRPNGGLKYTPWQKIGIKSTPSPENSPFRGRDPLCLASRLDDQSFSKCPKIQHKSLIFNAVKFLLFFTLWR